jgi:hypothetical protein
MSDLNEQKIIAIDLIIAAHDKLEAEHKALPSGFFGIQTKRHNQIMTQSRALKLACKLIKELQA